jgi:PAS domain-containing protein
MTTEDNVEIYKYKKELKDLVEKRTSDLKKAHERLAMAVEASGAGIYDHAVPLDDNTYHSDRWAEILGYTVEELPPQMNS